MQPPLAKYFFDDAGLMLRYRDGDSAAFAAAELKMRRFRSAYPEFVIPINE